MACESSPVSRFALVVLLLGLVRCAAPLQNGGVEFFDGADARLQAMCKWRRGEGLPDQCLPPLQSSQAPAKAFVIDDERVLLRGPYALGQPGDVMIENGEIAVVIAAVAEQSGPLAGGGVLIDAGDAHQRIDQLSVFAPTAMDLPSEGPGAPGSARGWIADGLDLGSDPDGVAWVEVHGRLAGAGRIHTRYALAPGARALHISTVTEAGHGVALGDEVHWGSAAPQPVGPTLDAVGGAVGYSVIPKRAWSDVRRAGAFSRVLARPASSTTQDASAGAYHRLLAVSVRGDTLALASELTFLGGGDLGALSVSFVDARGRPAATPTAGTIGLTRKSGPQLQLSVAGARSATAPPEVEAEAPVGTYLVSYRGPSGSSIQQTQVRVVPGEVARAVLALQPHGRLELRVTDGTGAVVSVTEVHTGEVVLSSEPIFGERSVPAPPGRYRVVAARGLEHTQFEQVVELTEGRAQVVELAPDRSVDPASLVGCELVRGALFGSESDSIGARVRTRLATGAKCVIVTERGAVVDVSPIVTSFGGQHVVVVAAVESPIASSGLGLSLVMGPPSVARGRWARLAAAPDAHTAEHVVAPGLWSLPSPQRGSPSGLPSPRLYVRAHRDGAGLLDAADLRSALLQGREAVLTRGPLLRAELSAAQIGGVASLSEQEDRLRIVVQRPPWITVDRIEVLVDGEVRLTLPSGDSVAAPLPETVHYEVVVSRNGAGAAQPRLTIGSDAAITFLVHGWSHATRESAVIASTAPLWVDADGDGRVGEHLAKKQAGSWRIPKALSD